MNGFEINANIEIQIDSRLAFQFEFDGFLCQFCSNAFFAMLNFFCRSEFIIKPRLGKVPSQAGQRRPERFQYIV